MLEIAERTMRPGEVARFLGVDPKTISRYANSGRIPCSTTPAGHRRFNLTEVRLALAMPPDAAMPGNASSPALLALELEQIETDVARLNLRMQAFTRSVRDCLTGRPDGG